MTKTTQINFFILFFNVFNTHLIRNTKIRVEEVGQKKPSPTEMVAKNKSNWDFWMDTIAANTFTKGCRAMKTPPECLSFIPKPNYLCIWPNMEVSGWGIVRQHFIHTLCWQVQENGLLPVLLCEFLVQAICFCGLKLEIQLWKSFCNP